MEEKITMDFVEWCNLVLRRMIEVTSASSVARNIGVNGRQLGQTLFGQFAIQPEFDASTQREGMNNALRSLQQVSLLELSRCSWKPTKLARDLIRENDMTSLWQGICQEKLDQAHQELLLAVNKLSPHVAADYVWLEKITHETLLAELGWAEGTDLLWFVSEELEEWNLISCSPYIGSHECYATYRGLVWETRRGLIPENAAKQSIIHIEKPMGLVIGDNNTVTQNFYTGK